MRKLIISGICCSALICGVASADGLPSSSTTDSSATESTNPFAGFYLGIQPGYADTNYNRKWLTDKTGFTSVSSVESRDYAARALVGYSFNKFFALESGVLFLQGIKFKNINNTVDDDINQEIVDLVGKATLPMGYVGPYIKAGGAYVHRNELKVGTARYRANNKYVPVLGGGLSIFITENVTIGGEYDRYIPSGDFKRTDFYGASLIYQFS